MAEGLHLMLLVLLFVANAIVICFFYILTFLVNEGSLMAKGLHQGLLGLIKYPSTIPLFKAVLDLKYNYI